MNKNEIHTCHDDCERQACVKIRKLEQALAVAEDALKRYDFPLTPQFITPHRAAVYDGMHDSVKKIMDDLMTLEEAHYSLSMLMNYFSWKTDYLNDRKNKE